MDDDRATNGADGSGVKVERAIVVFRTYGGKGGLEKERELGLGQELVPKKEVGEGGRDTGEDAEKMSFEGADGTFGGVTAMGVGGTSWYVHCQSLVVTRWYLTLALLSRIRC